MGKTSQKKKEKRLAGRVSLALAAGMFSALPVAHGMPTLDPAGTHKDYAETPSVVGNTMSVTGTGTNNVIDWKDFSVKAGETVAFQKVNDLPANYMNIVTGNATSNIEGRITNAGDVYLINPNGVIFGKGAKVDVGNLYVSTREANSVDIAGFKGGTASGESVLSVAASPTTDVVNLIDSTTNGYVRAEKVVMEGRNIRFLDSSSVIQAGTGTVNETTGVLTGGTANAESANLVLRSNNFDGTNGYIHVGDASGNYVYTTNKKNGNTPVIGNVGNTGNDKKEKENQGVVNYALVRDAAGLNSINNNGGNANSGIGLAGNYMLADDITNAGTVQIGTGSTSGTGNAFTGKFDGMFNTVSGLSQSGNTKYLGLFGHTSEARIENVGVKNAQLTGMYAGSIVGYAENSTKLLNVWNEGGGSTYIGPTAYGQFTGGLVGTLKSSELKNSYNAGAVHGAGLVSQLQGSSTIEDSYNIGATKAYSNKIYGLVRLAGDSNDKIINSYSAAAYLNGATDPEVFSDSGTYTNSYIIKSTTSYKHGSQTVNDTYTLTKNTTGLYSNWSISSEGGANTTWRIYEGASLPLLNSFMKAKGTVAAEYTYDKNGVSTQSVNDTSSKVYSATKVDPTNIVLYGANGAAQKATDGTAVKDLTGTQFAASTRKDVYTGSGTTATKFALLYGGQQGYDLYGNNFTITKRSVLFTPGDNPEFTKVYDGTLDAKAALASALSGATSGTTGFLAADQQYVTSGKVGFTFSNIDANYTDKNVGTGKTITVSETAGQTASVSLTATDTNYQYIVDNYDVAGNLNDMFGTYESGIITARPVLVDLTTKTGIDKVYDGTSDVTKDGCVGAENLTASGIDENTASGLVSDDHAMLSATSVYVDASGNETKNVAGTTGAVRVAYKDIVAKDTDGNTGNYAFYYKVGENLVAVNDSPLTAGGTITPRTISKDDLVLKDAQGNEMGTTEKPITKTYNGTTTKSLGDGTTAAYASGAIIDNNTDAGKATAKSTETGLLATDAANMTFASTGTVTFYKSDGETQTSFATANGGAQRAGFGVELTVTDDSILTNYQWSDAVGSELATGVDKVGVNGTGVINKREITVAPKWDSGIDKVYDGDKNVKDVTGGNAYATGNYKITSGSLVADATTGSTPALGISGTPTYSDKNVEYDGTTPKAKSIAYTIALSGAAAGNYNLNNTGTTATTLNATGTITPKELTVTFGDVTKSYNTTADVTGITPNWDGLVTGDSANDTAISGKYVAKDAQGEYQNASDVGSYLNDGTKAVMYTGIVDALGENAKNYKINGKHYTLSNTEYGRGYITARKISLEQLKSYLDPKGNLTKTYDATEKYTNDMVTANNLAASDYLKVDTTAVNTDIGAHTLMEGAATDIQAVINGKLTIAEAVYRNADGSNAVNASDTSYTNVSMTFNMDGTGKTKDTGDQKYYITVGNYDFEWAESFSDAASGTPATTGRTGTITPKGLTVTVANATKIYDGTKNVKANGVVFDASNDTFKSWFTFTGMVDNETVTLANGATATYDNENADAAGSTPTERITYSGLVLADGTGKASNYKIVDSQGATINSITGVGTINKRNVTLSDYGVAAATKTYDGDAEVEAYALTFADVTQEGATDKSVLAADHITDASGKIVSNLTGTYLPTGSQTQGQGKDVLRDANDRTNILAKNVEYTGDALTNLYGGNYNVTLANGGIYNSTTGKLTVTGGGKINPAQIQVNNDEIVAAAANRVYDGTKLLENPAIDYLTFNNADLNAHRNDLTVTGAYDSKNAGARTVTYTISMDANNYDLSGDIYDDVTGTATKTGSGTISKKTIYGVVGATAEVQKSTISKVYDGYTTVEDADVTAAKTWLTTNLSNDGSGAVAITDEDGNLDDVSIVTTGVTLAYKDANVATSGDNNKVTYSGLALTGTDAENYTLGNATVDEKKVAYGYGSITPKSIAFNITVADGTYKKDYDGKTGLDGKLDGVDTTNSNTLAAAVTAWWSGPNGVRAAGDTTGFGDAFETDTGGNLVGYYGVWNPTTKTFTENSNVWADKANNKKTSDVYYGLALKGDAAQNYVLASTGGTTGATINVNNTTIQNTVYFQNAMQGKGEIKPLAISMEKVNNEWGTFEKVYDRSTAVEGYLADGTPTLTKEQQLTIYYERDNVEGYTAGDVKIPYSVEAANYADANAGDGKNIAYTGFSFNDSDLDNFVIPEAALRAKYADGAAATTTTGNIARRLLVVDADNTAPVAPAAGKAADNTKIYDGSSALFTGSKMYEDALMQATSGNLQNASGLVGNDQVSVTYTANFANGSANADIDPDTVKDGTGWTTRDVIYSFTLKNTDGTEANTGVAKNYTLVQNGADASKTDTRQGAIRRREVYVDFATDNADVYQGEGLDKIYDGDSRLFKDANNSTSLLASGKSVNEILTLVSATNDTGIVGGEPLTLDTGNVTANYVDADGHASADSDAKLGITTRKVYIQNLNLTGTGNANNYVVKAVKKQGDTQDTNTLEGKGSVAQRQVAVGLSNTAPVTKVYDKTESLKGFSATDITPVDITTIVPASGIVGTDNLGLSVESAIYYDTTTGKPQYNAQGGLGVSYRLKWNNANYSLVKVSVDELADKEFVKDSVTGNLVGYGTLNTDSVGTITPRTLTYKDESSLSVDKTYDGTTDVKDASAVATGIFAYATAGSDTGLVAGDEKDLLMIDAASHYDSPNTGATAATGIKGTPQKVTLGFTVNDNYRLDANNNLYDQDMHPIIEATGTADANGYKSGTYTGPGRINRAEVTMTPTEVSYYPSQLANATYSGSPSGFVNGDARPTMTYGRDGNTATAAGNYTLLGYVNGTRIGTGDTFVDGVENYYFKTTPNTYLHILAEPVNPDVPVIPDIPDIPDIPGIDGKPVTQAVTETVISDKKFTPDDYSYNRISKDQDLTRLNRESSASVQYAEKGVNLDGGDTKSGLSALADIQGAGSVVNLEGAFIRTSAPAEQPETVAAEAALPVPETEESDISSISLEYAGDGENSQALLEILTNASSNAEKKGTSIVIDAQDEDEEDAEEEKSRRAIFADRSNIGIETLGDAVNLNQMIG